MEREKGTVVKWDDEKGYGFIRPHDKKEDIFLHVKSIPHNQRRPKPGDVVTYLVEIKENNRYYASSVKITGLAWSGFTMLCFGMVLCAGIYLYLAFRQRLPFYPVATIYGIMSLATIRAYSRDKQAAKLRRWRTRELNLHLLEAVGGWPGALLAQLYYRHKSRKLSYLVVFWLIVAGHGGLWYYMFTHQDVYRSYRETLTGHAQTLFSAITGETQRLFSRGQQAPTSNQAVRTDQPEQANPPQTGRRSIVLPAKNARIVAGIVKEIRPAEGVLVALQGQTGTEGMLAKATLVKNFATRFTPGEQIQVAIRAITIAGKQKRIELVLVEKE